MSVTMGGKKKALYAEINRLAASVAALEAGGGGSGGSDSHAVKYVSQSLTSAQKTQARSNIGAGTSSFSGAYSALSGKPTIPAVKLNGVTKSSVNFQLVGSVLTITVG